MDAIVQLIRNAMCCVKDLNLFAESLPNLYDPEYTSKFYTFPTPFMSKTTPLEFLICISQLYACISCTISGYNLIFGGGILKLKRLTRVSDLVHKKRLDKAGSKKKDDDKDDKADKDDAIVNQVVATSVMKEANGALRNVFVGICVLPIGMSFFWLFCNSLHITEAGWVGGLPALIHALTVMEIALVPLLYFMLKDASSALRKAVDIRAMVEKFSEKKNKDVAPSGGELSWINLDSYSLIVDSGWSPYWTTSAISNVDQDAEGKMLTKEIEALERNVKSSLSGDAAIVNASKAAEMEEAAQVSYLEGYREYAYFVFNFIAFYGYLLGVVVYYFDADENQPAAVRQLKLGYSNDDADWGGNFAGDFMWTVEPIVILLSPFIISRLTKSKGDKVKKD
mmetsp:Transcript_15529/g.22625  ORF Transcript_15529/g.22625 Transcript_15529/m.22625 type:complete len:395 (-) Transcript_15529:39-1223(-)